MFKRTVATGAMIVFSPSDLMLNEESARDLIAADLATGLNTALTVSCVSCGGGGGGLAGSVALGMVGSRTITAGIVGVTGVAAETAGLLVTGLSIVGGVASAAGIVYAALSYQKNRQLVADIKAFLEFTQAGNWNHAVDKMIHAFENYGLFKGYHLSTNSTPVFQFLTTADQSIDDAFSQVMGKDGVAAIQLLLAKCISEFRGQDARRDKLKGKLDNTLALKLAIKALKNVDEFVASVKGYGSIIYLWSRWEQTKIDEKVTQLNALRSDILRFTAVHHLRDDYEAALQVIDANPEAFQSISITINGEPGELTFTQFHDAMERMIVSRLAQQNAGSRP